LAGDIAAGRTLLQGGTHHHIVNLARIDAGTLHRFADRMRPQAGGIGVVEGAAIGLADRRAGGGYDDGFAHDWFPPIIGLGPNARPKFCTAQTCRCVRFTRTST